MAVGDTGSRLVGNTEFYGGLSTDRKIGIENSYYYYKEIEAYE